jgi:bifunctional N-acetylglucosamine-1-phosphate-uridyltransferase/glucosamine-1-phosphate-acetyltransferase GlmU-like protein
MIGVFPSAIFLRLIIRQVLFSYHPKYLIMNTAQKITDRDKFVVVKNEKRSVLQRLNQHTAGSAMYQETSSGKPETVNNVAAAFAVKQKEAVYKIVDKPDFWLPDWVRQHIDAKRSQEDLIKMMLQRVQDKNEHETILEAQSIFNEIGRSAGGGTLLKKYITPLLIAKIIAK